MVQGYHGVRGLLTAILARRKQLDLPHTSFALLPKFDAGKPGSETGINLKAGMRVKYMGSKSWLAPHVDRLLGDVAVLHPPFFGSEKLEYYLATRRPALKVRGVDAFEPVANLHRCYLRQDPVFLRSLLRLAGRKIDRRFYFSHLLPGSQRGRAGRRAACLYVLLRNSFSKKWGSFTRQRPLELSSVRRMQRPPRNVTARCQDALAYLRALPRQAPRQAMYADPPYIPDRSMNYYGTRRRGRDLAFHSELRDALFASGLPFVLSINDVPEAWELYSRAGSITRLCSGKNSSKPELLVVHRGNPAGGAILRPQQDWSVPNPGLPARARPAPGPHQARTRPTPGPHRKLWSEVGFPTSVERILALRPQPWSWFCFSKPFAHFSAPKSGDEAVHCGESVFGP